MRIACLRILDIASETSFAGVNNRWFGSATAGLCIAEEEEAASGSE